MPPKAKMILNRGTVKQNMALNFQKHQLGAIKKTFKTPIMPMASMTIPVTYSVATFKAVNKQVIPLRT